MARRPLALTPTLTPTSTPTLTPTLTRCGPSPVLIHLDQLRQLTPGWMQLSFDLKRDAEADKVLAHLLSY